MSEFVEECRREWKRLRVPDPVANEMAADLAADLEEAAAEGASAEEVLGSGAFDPRSFAASWAAERGVIQPAPVNADRLPRRPRMLAAITALTAVAIIGAALTIGASHDGPTRVALVASRPPQFRLVLPAVPFGLQHRLLPQVTLTPPAGGFVEDMSPTASVYLHTIGVILLLVGVVGLMLSLVYWSPWASSYRPRRQSPTA